MPHLPIATNMAAARIELKRWGIFLTQLERVALELVATCIVDLSRRRPEGWTEWDLLTETTLPYYRFDQGLLRDGVLMESFFEAPKTDMMNVLAAAQYTIIYRDEIEPDNLAKEG
ncbi:hypothetical protein [Aureimonas ureilytica]|uniref:hypothetical protein n=1 Tax=Aureimonas ureilytica TaxID=401562 RepID=UPI0003784E91|nr:hypothetical protein [Aureimonas ureilytica]